MTLRIIGAGLPRTGTNSLKVALEQLLDGPCYHMHELFDRPNDALQWERAAKGNPLEWAEFLKEFKAAVDWPPSLFWQELAMAFPDAPILLSTRQEPDIWWASVSKTIVPATLQAEDTPWRSMAESLFNKFIGSGDFQNGEIMMAAYEAHNDKVRATVPAGRLIEWQPEDGWAPICKALGMAVPKEPFPHVNTRAEFTERIGSPVPAPND